MLWLTVSNAFVKSIKVMLVILPSSKPFRTLSTTFSIACIVDLFVLKPNCSATKSLFISKIVSTRYFNTDSKIFDKIGRIAIGR